MELLLLLLGLDAGLLLGLQLGRRGWWRTRYTPLDNYGLSRLQGIRFVLADRARFDEFTTTWVGRWYFTLKAILAILLDRERPLWREANVVVAQFQVGDDRTNSWYWDGVDLVVSRKGLAYDIDYTPGYGY